ncbi:hypothetical protein D9Q98_009998 [Chlorella vulgaris]|jgi:hypothetical protein|uniref:Uncharacterized protein n=1 Tax=Chlorella vulgaris TaxID=3077 RepID=A0A9D4TFX7_CHLVU|nr:hypothetical protein D9Q98_009998 [Chlorella vulgaris]
MLTALTRLDLSGNSKLAGGWQHLQPLTRLQHLDLSHCNLTAIPLQVSALTDLTRLALSCNELDYPQTGWQHLQPLMRLQDLYLEAVLLSEEQVSLALAFLPQLHMQLHFAEWWA